MSILHRSPEHVCSGVQTQGSPCLREYKGNLRSVRAPGKLHLIDRSRSRIDEDPVAARVTLCQSTCFSLGNPLDQRTSSGLRIRDGLQVISSGHWL